MAGTGGSEYGAAEIRRRAAIEETAKWMMEQTKHVWRALGVRDEEDGGELKSAVKGTDTEFQFVYRQRVLAKARGYFSWEERQWRFELTEVDRERYEAVRAYFAGRR